jgi:hypothetical protein
VDRVVVPVLDADQGDRCAVADVDLDICGVLRGANVIEDDCACRMRRDVDDDVPVRDAAGAASPATVTTSASVAFASAMADNRSNGVCTAPTRGSVIGTTCTGASALHE